MGIEARKMVGKRDDEDKHEEQDEEQKKLSELYGRKDQVQKQLAKVTELKQSFTQLNKAAQEAAEIRAKYKIKHTINDLVERQDQITGKKIDEKAEKAAKDGKKDDQPSEVQK